MFDVDVGRCRERAAPTLY